MAKETALQKAIREANEALAAKGTSSNITVPDTKALASKSGSGTSN